MVDKTTPQGNGHLKPAVKQQLTRLDEIIERTKALAEQAKNDRQRGVTERQMKEGT